MLAVIGGAVVRSRLGFMERSTRELSAMIAERDRLGGVQPPATAGSHAALLALEVAQTDRCDELAAALGMKGEIGGERRELTAEAQLAGVLALTDYANRLRELAQAEGVRVAADEEFGFAAWVAGGRPVEQLPPLLRQMEILEPILATLLAARPVALLAVRREKPPDEVAGGRLREVPAAAAMVRGVDRDEFELPPEFSVREAGILAATAFRLEFSGRTAALRRLLTGLLSAGGNVVVRAVEVAPLDEPLRRADGPGNGGVGLAGKAPASLSRFAVTVEVVSLVPDPPEPNVQ